MDEIKFEFMRGQGKGGQHRNKTDSCVRATHVATGISVTIDGRNQHANKRKAVKILRERLREAAAERDAEKRKQRRDAKIKDRTIVRTYDYGTGLVTDHRTGKRAAIKQVVGKGRLELLRGDK